MRVLMIGAGIIGSIYGWALAESGHHVVHLVRPGRAAALRDGSAIDIFDRRKGHPRKFQGFYRLDAIEALSPADIFDLVVLPVKHYGLARTLEDIVPRLDGAEFLILTQNWRGTAEIDSMLPRTRYIFGDAKAGGSFSGRTLIAALSSIDIGPAEGEPSALANKAAALFASADIPARLHSDMLHYLWVQYAITGGPWAALVQAGSFDAMLDNREAALGALEAASECLQVVKGRGIDLSLYPEAKPLLRNSALRRRFYIWIMRRMFRKDEYTMRCSAHALADPVEIKTFYDDLVGTGLGLGVPMPVMESYAEKIRRFATAT